MGTSRHGASVAFLSFFERDHYEVEKALVGLSVSDQHVNHVCRVVKRHGGERQREVCLSYLNTDVARFV